MRQYSLFGYPIVEEIEVPCLPYMGSKRKIANALLNAIYRTVGDFDKIYDLFGGGGAFSTAALIAGHKVVYNEYNPAIADLVRHVISGGEIPKTWISRERFFELITGTDWRAGLAMCCWSFGNNQKSYLFGTDVEPLKKLGHEIVVDQSAAAKKELETLLNMPLPDFKSREQFSSFFRKMNNRLDLEQLERLQQLEQLQQLEIKNLCYSQVEIMPGAVIYCDPPYEDTAGYKKGIDHAAFWEYCRRQTAPVFISEYNAPPDFKAVAEIDHRSTLSATNNKATTERLFWNGVQL